MQTQTSGDEEFFWGHFRRLNEHLTDIQPTLRRFCARHGFEFVPRISLGRYPRQRIERPGNPRLWFDLSMEADPKGVRYQFFFTEAPYHLGAGATYEENGIVYSMSFSCFDLLPWTEVLESLEVELETHLPTLESWTADDLRSRGEPR